MLAWREQTPAMARPVCIHTNRETVSILLSRMTSHFPISTVSHPIHHFATCHSHRNDAVEGCPYSGADVTQMKIDTTRKIHLGYKGGDWADLLGINNARDSSPGDALAEVGGLLVSPVLKNGGILSWEMYARKLVISLHTCRMDPKIEPAAEICLPSGFPRYRDCSRKRRMSDLLKHC